MELALSLGDASKPFSLLEKPQKMAIHGKDLGFCMGLPSKHENEERRASSDPPLQLNLFSSIPRSPQQPSWISDHLVARPANSSDGPVVRGGVGVDVNRLPAAGEDDGAAISSPNSTVSSFQMEFSSIYGSGGGGGRRRRDDLQETADAGCNSRASDDDDNALTRKKLRLSKEQSAFLEESFKEHHTLNPKQKLALARQLNLRPRQVEVWFQNRRARTKLKQTEVDCEYLRRCCETLTEENRRLQKELQELRALKTSQPFYMQLPATTLTMCPSCERVASSTSAAAGGIQNIAATATGSAAAAMSTSKPRAYPFPTASQNEAASAPR